MIANCWFETERIFSYFLVWYSAINMPSIKMLHYYCIVCQRLWSPFRLQSNNDEEVKWNVKFQFHDLLIWTAINFNQLNQDIFFSISPLDNSVVIAVILKCTDREIKKKISNDRKAEREIKIMSAICLRRYSTNTLNCSRIYYFPSIDGFINHFPDY